MVFLAALAGAGGYATSGLAGHWRRATGGATVQVPEPAAAAAAALLGPAAHRLTRAELAAALQPWLGEEPGRPALTLPAVFSLPADPPPDLEQALARAAPGALVSRDTVWQQRLALLAGGLQACAALAVVMVACVAAGVVAITTRTSLATHRDAIEIIHNLGADDGSIAGPLARRVTLLALAGAVAGTLLAALLVAALAYEAAPFETTFAVAPSSAGTRLAGLPEGIWALLAGLPPAAALLGWLTAQATVRAWLVRLP